MHPLVVMLPDGLCSADSTVGDELRELLELVQHSGDLYEPDFSQLVR